MTEEEREKLINDMEIAILKEGVGTILHSSQLSRMARAALVIAEGSISKDSCARIAELEATNSVLRDAVQKFVDYDSTYHKDKEKMMLDYEVAIAAARAALKGEK